MSNPLSRRAVLAAGALSMSTLSGVKAAEDGTNIPDAHTVDGSQLPPSAPTAVPEPTPTELPELSLDGAIFPDHRVLSYYGFPGNPYMGILGEYIGRIMIETKGRPLFIVRKRYGGGDAAAGKAPDAPARKARRAR